MTCSTAVLEPSTTSVRRAMFGSWVWPMVRLSISKPRCRNRLTTRFRTDGWSASVATNVCFIGNHLTERRAGHDHRKDVLLGLSLELDHGRAWLGHRRRHRGVDLLRTGHPPARDLVRLGDQHVVGHAAAQVHPYVVVLVEQLLPLAHHAQVPVVNEGDLDR